MQFSDSDEGSAYNSDSDVEDVRKVGSNRNKRPRAADERKGTSNGAVNNTTGDNLFDFSDGEEGSDEDGGDRKRSRAERGGKGKGRGGRKGLDDGTDSEEDGGMASESDEDTNAPPKTPILDLLSELCGLLNVDESVGDAYARLSAAASAAPAATKEAADSKKALIHGLTQKLLIQHGTPTMGLGREEVVALYHTKAAASGLLLTPAYALEWAHSKGKLYGPFAAAQMQKWKDGGVFKQKKAATRNVNASVVGDWEDADAVTTY